MRLSFEETDKIIEEFIKIRDDKEELKILRQRPSMLGDLINFVIEGEKE